MSSGVAGQSRARLSARSALAMNLVSLRHATGWSQKALVFESGLHRTFVAHVERQSRNIALDNVERLAWALALRSISC